MADGMHVTGEQMAAIAEAIAVFRAMAAECFASAVWYDAMDTGSDAGSGWAESAAINREGAKRWSGLADRLSARSASPREETSK